MDHIQTRCGLIALLVSSAAFAADRAPAPRQREREIRVATTPVVMAGVSTRARPLAPGIVALTPARFEGFVLSQTLRDSIVAIALAQLGQPYVYGEATPRKGFDCSGLVRYAMSQVHMSVPRTALQQAEIGAPVERRNLERGDLLAFGEDTVVHIGIYLGAGRFIHASSVAGKVIVSPLDRAPSRLIHPMKGARRLLATADLPARRGG